MKCSLSICHMQGHRKINKSKGEGDAVIEDYTLQLLTREKRGYAGTLCDERRVFLQLLQGKIRLCAVH